MPKAIHKTPTRDYVLELVRKLPGLSCKQLFESSQHTNGLSVHSINSALSHMFSVDQTVWRIRQKFCDINGHPTYKFVYFIYGGKEHTQFAETNRIPTPGQRPQKSTTVFDDAAYQVGSVPSLASLSIITANAVANHDAMRISNAGVRHAG